MKKLKTKNQEIAEELRKQLTSKGYLKRGDWHKYTYFFDGKLYVLLEVGTRNANVGIHIYTGQATRKLIGVNMPIKTNPKASEIIKIYKKYLKHAEKFHDNVSK